MPLLAIAYPELNTSDFELIQNCRRVNDKLYYNIIAPHFTFVFPVPGIPVEDFTKEIKTQLAGVKPVSFCIRCATISKDAFSETYHTFLVPDEGYSAIVKLHDKLYSSTLAPHHRLDIDFIPHIGDGNSTDKMICKKIVDNWNANDFAISGTISSVEVINYEQGLIETIAKIILE